jgi:nucleotide-binding universal stress UspA family protein
MDGAKSDVGVFVDRGMQRVGRILVPYLGSEQDREALDVAKRIAENTGAVVTLLDVVVPGAQKAADTREPASAVGKGKVELRSATHAVPTIAVVEETQRGGYDLMIIGMDRHWGLAHRSFGFEAEAILKQPLVSVLVVRKELAPKSARAGQAVAAGRARFGTVPDA